MRASVDVKLPLCHRQAGPRADLLTSSIKSEFQHETQGRAGELRRSVRCSSRVVAEAMRGSGQSRLLTARSSRCNRRGAGRAQRKVTATLSLKSGVQAMVASLCTLAAVGTPDSAIGGQLR